MNYILISGMHERWCDFASSQLITMGLSPSIRGAEDALDLEKFTHKLCDTYNVSTDRSSKFRQISPGKAWHISATSIIIDNSENKNWCWGTPDNIFLLDFWKAFGELTKFVLVYGCFEDFLAQQNKLRDLTVKQIEKLAKQWKSYHAEMLKFYYANKDRCLLVDISSFVSQGAEIADSLLDKFDIEGRIINSRAFINDNPIEVLAQQNHIQTLQDMGTDTIFSELENSADVNSDQTLKQSALSEAAIEEYRRLEARIIEMEDKLSNNELIAEGQQYQVALSKNKQLAAENKLVLAQLHQVQEELEFYFKKTLQLEENANLKPGHPVEKTLASNGPTLFAKNVKSAQDVTLDFANFINGSGWHNAEDTGRWSGPSTTSTIYVRKLEPTAYKMEVRILDGMSPTMLDKLQIYVGGQELKTSLRKLSDMRGPLAPLRRIKANMKHLEKPYPAIISATIPKTLIDPEKNVQTFEFVVPNVQQPIDTSNGDTRDLSLFYEKITLTAC